MRSLIESRNVSAGGWVTFGELHRGADPHAAQNALCYLQSHGRARYKL